MDAGPTVHLLLQEAAADLTSKSALASWAVGPASRFRHPAGAQFLAGADDLENRQAVGRDVYGFGGGGVYDATHPYGAPAGLRVLKQGARGTSVLLDPTPTACNSYCPWDDDVVIVPGTTFRSVADGVEIRSRQLADGHVVADVSVAGAGEAHWVGVEDPPGEATVITVAAAKPRSTATTPLSVTVTTAARVAVAGGTVTVSAGDVRLAGATVSRGRAPLVLPALPRGRQDLVVAYEPPPTGTPLAGSSTALPLDVLGALSRVSASLALRTVTIADAPSVTVSVSASGATPTGTVAVTENGTSLGTGELVRGRATVALPVQALGRHSLVATYDGDSTVVGASSTPAVLTVTPLPVSVVSATVSKATAGQQATVTATVRAAGRPDSGEVSVVRDDQTVASGQLVNGRVLLRLPALPAGRHQLSVVHADSERVTGGAKALALVVAPAKPSIRAVLGAAPVTQGSTATITVDVGTPGVEAAGTVRLMRSRSALDEVGLADGQAVLTVPADLPVGRQSLTVAFAGSSELAAGSAMVTVTVVR